MRTLLLLRGAPGSGKSTFIKENNLEEYTLEADKIRSLYNNPQLTEDFKFSNTQKDDSLAWNTLYTALENRMKNGEFTIIDATHADPSRLTKYRNLAQIYRYQVYYYDMETPIETILERNLTRIERDQVPRNEVLRIYETIKQTEPRKFAKKVTDINNILNYYVDNLDRFNKVLLIGDIQGCHTALSELIGSELKDDIAYIFVGDLLDRGIENKQVLDFVLSIYKKQNVFFVEGNHDEYLRRWAFDSWEIRKDKPFIPYEFKHRTQPQIEQSSFSDIINDIQEKLTQAESRKAEFLKSINKDQDTLSIKFDRYLNRRFSINDYKRLLNDAKSQHNKYVEQLKSDVRQLSRKFRQAYAFTFGQHKIFVCHAGISYLPKMTFIPTYQLIRGVGDYETEIDEIWEDAYSNDLTQGFTQVHGHRHTQSTEHSICLEDDVENGGHLVALELTKDNATLRKVKNRVFRPKQEIAERDIIKEKIGTTQNDTINKMIGSKFINVKRQPHHNLISLNFTKSAFKKGRWNRQTITARGLFVDELTGDVKIRSYNKFFNLNEVRQTRVKNLKNSLAFPIYAYKKENGFLGIGSTINGKFQLASKSQTFGPFYEYFHEIFNTLTQKEIDTLTKISEKYNCSFTFEVLHVDDKHMIDFNHNQLVLLDAIPNQLTLNGKTVDKEFSDKVKKELIFESPHFSQKQLIATFNSMDELLEYADLHTNDRDSEGLVIEDSNGFMFKIKYNYYSELKKLRGVFHFVRSSYHSGIKYGRLRTPREVAFARWLELQPYSYLQQGHIITLFKDYEKQVGKML